MKLTPYLTFNGNCEEALNFYVGVFGGEIKELKRFEGSPIQNMAANPNMIMHARFEANGITLMASDGGHGESNGRAHVGVSMSVEFDDEGQIQNVFSKLSDGGQVVMPLEDTFWGAKFGMLKDKFGVNWMFNYQKNQPE
ncbi:MAG: VOC family protein [Candidatus Dadabacteria bacterium]